MPKITKTFLASLPDLSVERFYWDDDLPGFGVRVKPRRRSYVIQYRDAARRTRRYTLGNCAILNVDLARKKAKRLLAEITCGKDPAAEKKARLHALTVSELCDTYLGEAQQKLVLNRRGEPKKASTLATDRGRVERHIKPLLGSRTVESLSARHIGDFQADIAAGKSATDIRTGCRGRARVRGGRGTASRTVGLLGGILSFAVRRGIITSNPVHGVQRYADGHRGRILSNAELRLLGLAIAEARALGVNPLGLLAFELCMLSGMRKGEVLGLRWEEVDTESHCLRLADSKTGKSIRPLGADAFGVLARVHRGASPYVFPASRGAGHLVALPSISDALFVRAGAKGATLHTLRHTYASLANHLGYTEPTIAAMLGHARSGVTARYIHHVDAALIAAADRTSAHISQLVYASPVLGDESSARPQVAAE